MLLPIGRFAVLLFPIVTLAVPTSTCITSLPIKSAECKLVNVVVNSLKAIPSVTPFCSSFLHISAATKTKTVTAVIPSTSTTYISTTATINRITRTTQTVTATSYTSTETETETVTSTVTYNACGTPTVAKRAVIPSKLAGFASSQLSTACKCLNIPTPTSTVTVSATSVKDVVVSAEATVLTTVLSTLTVTVTTTIQAISTTTTTTTSSPTIMPTSCPAPASCNNQGVQFAVYQNVDGRADPDNYPNWNPQGYKTVQPLYQGVTPHIGEIYCGAGVDATCSIYDQFTYPAEFVGVDHRGYFYAGQTGTYTLTLVQPVDNVAEIWLGNKAYSGWTRANSDAEGDLAQLRDPNRFPPRNVFRVYTLAGRYLPFRVFWANAGVQGEFHFSITAPDGTSLQDSPFLVQFSCDGSTAPPYAAWGSET